MADRQMVSVDAVALRTVLEALNGPSHLIREIQMTRGVAALTGDDPIQTLVDDFNRAVAPTPAQVSSMDADRGGEPSAAEGKAAP